MIEKKQYSQKNGNLSIMKNNPNEKKPRVFIGTINLLTKEHKLLGRSKKTRMFTDTVLIIIIALILLGGVAYLIKNYNIGRNIILEARYLSETIKTGNLEFFELDYKNNNKETIKNVNITMEFPENFVLKSMMPEDIFDASTNTINLGTLNSGANGKIKFSGFILGEINTQQFINFSLNYSASGLKMSCKHTLIYLIEDSVLNLKVSWPKEIYQDSLFSGNISLHNESENILENIEVLIDDRLLIERMDVLDGLTYGSNKLYLNSLDQNEKIVINFDALVKNIEGQQNFNFSAKLNGFKQVDLSKNILVNVPKFKVSITPQNSFIQSGNKISFNFNYKNNEDIDLKDIKFDIQPVNNFIIGELDIRNNTQLSRVGNSILLNEDLAPQASGSFTIDVLLKRNKVEINQQAGIKAMISYSKVGELIQYPIYSSQIKLLSNLNIESAGYYYSPYGDQLGTGPIPPIVDIPTNYWMFWEAENFGNDLSNFSLTADLPLGLVWTNNKSVLSGNLQYGEISRRIIWSIDDISAQGGEYKARFEVGLIPKIKDIGRVLDLLQNIKFYAQDNFCETQIFGTAENINTDLKDDDLVSGKGKVVDFK